MNLAEAVLRALSGLPIKGSRIRLVDRTGTDIPETEGDVGVVLGAKWPHASIRIGRYVQLVHTTQIVKIEEASS